MRGRETKKEANDGKRKRNGCDERITLSQINFWSQPWCLVTPLSCVVRDAMKAWSVDPSDTAWSGMSADLLASQSSAVQCRQLAEPRQDKDKSTSNTKRRRSFVTNERST